MPEWLSSTRAGIRLYLAPFVDNGFGLIYDRERNLTWLRDANYAKTVALSPDGQMSWDTAMRWVARLSYAGIRGWRLPTAYNSDGSGPEVGENRTDTELGRLFTASRGLPGSVSADNFYPYSIYWTSTEASEREAYAFRLLGLRQAPLVKDPFAADSVLGSAIPLTDLVLAWPVHDGDVAAEIRRRWTTAIYRVIAKPFVTHREGS